MKKHKIPQDGQRIYTINTRREQIQNTSRRATHIHNKSLGSDGGNKRSAQRVKDPLSFEIWIFRNG